jgi:hypothetical protein
VSSISSDETREESPQISFRRESKEPHSISMQQVKRTVIIERPQEILLRLLIVFVLSWVENFGGEGVHLCFGEADVKCWNVQDNTTTFSKPTTTLNFLVISPVLDFRGLCFAGQVDLLGTVGDVT